MSFQALFAVFAALVVGFGVLARVTRENTAFIDTVSDVVNSYIPGLIATSTEAGEVELSELLNQQAIGWASLIGAVSLVWVTMSWFTSTRRSVRLVFGLDVKEYRNWMLLKLRDFFGALGFFIAIVLSAALTVVSSSLFRQLLEFIGVPADHWVVGGLGTVASYVLTFAVDAVIVLGIHRFLAEAKVPTLRLVEGSLLAAALLFGLKLLASFVIGVAPSNPLLSTFAVFVALLLWFNLMCRVLLLSSAWMACGEDRSLGLPESGIAA